MSGSKDKKLRKNQRDSGLNLGSQKDKDREAEQARRKQTRTAVILLAILAVLAVVVFILNSNFFYRNMTALNVDGQRFSIADMNFFTSMAGSNEEGVEAARRSTVLHRRAMEEGLTLDEEARAQVQMVLDEVTENFAQAGFPNANTAVSFWYGRGMNMRILRERLEFNALGQMYTNLFVERLHDSYTEADLEAYYTERRDEYDRVSFRVHELPITPDDMVAIEGDAIAEDHYTREEAMTVAELIVASVQETSEEFSIPEGHEFDDEGGVGSIDALTRVLDGDDEGRFLLAIRGFFGEFDDVDMITWRDLTRMVAGVLEYSDWLLDDSRAPGDITIHEGEESVFVVFFVESEDNRYYPVNVRHILITPEEVMDDVFEEFHHEQAMEVARIEAEELLARWEAGAATEESFIELVREYSEDNWEANSSPGLYEDINKQTGFVPEFLDWAMDPAREVGDVEIVETQFGFHIMYFSSRSDMLHRYEMARQAKSGAAYQEWLDGAMEAMSANSSYFSRLVVQLEPQDGGWDIW